MNSISTTRVMTHVHLPEWVINDFHQFGNFSLYPKLIEPMSKIGVKILHLDIGGDWVPRVLNTASENYFWNAMNSLDLLLSELEQNSQNKDKGNTEALHWLPICTQQDIDTAIKGNHIGVIISLGGGRPLEGKANLNLLSNLRHFHRLGLRCVQLAGFGRNRIADGVAEARTEGKLTYFGVDLVKEMLRLNMIIDVSAINNEGFAHLVELTGQEKAYPLVNSRANCKALSNHPLNITDKRIKDIAATGGVIGLSFYADQVAIDKKSPDVNDLVAHIEHIASLVGAEHIAIGGDVSPIDSPTPTRYERHPGLVNGIRFSERLNDYAEGFDTPLAIELIAEALAKKNYPQQDIDTILGGNMLSLYRQVLPK